MVNLQFCKLISLSSRRHYFQTVRLELKIGVEVSQNFPPEIPCTTKRLNALLLFRNSEFDMTLNKNHLRTSQFYLHLGKSKLYIGFYLISRALSAFKINLRSKCSSVLTSLILALNSNQQISGAEVKEFCASKSLVTTQKSNVQSQFKYP